MRRPQGRGSSGRTRNNKRSIIGVVVVVLLLLFFLLLLLFLLLFFVIKNPIDTSVKRLGRQVMRPQRSGRTRRGKREMMAEGDGSVVVVVVVVVVRNGSWFFFLLMEPKFFEF